MKKIYTLTIAAVATLALTGCTGSTAASYAGPTDVTKVDAQKTCDVATNGVANVLAVAKHFNPEAQKRGVEFMRFGAPTSEYIRATEEALAAGSDMANVKEKKETKKMKVDYTAWRACTFAVRAIQQDIESDAQWKEAVPGMGLKY
jgi:outer membrane biogenesis lipoprotein LolB